MCWNWPCITASSPESRWTGGATSTSTRWQVKGDHHRQEWFGCACCPPNVTRTLASLGGYAYAASDGGLWVNLYIQGSATAEVAGQKVTLDVTTDYPWDGKVTLTARPVTETAFALHLRVPGWCEGATVRVNGVRPRKHRDAEGLPGSGTNMAGRGCGGTGPADAYPAH